MHYCDYQIITETSSGIREVCRECKKVLLTKKGHKGRVDNKAYIKEHMRDVAQPNSKIFKQYYGEPVVEPPELEQFNDKLDV